MRFLLLTTYIFVLSFALPACQKTTQATNNQSVQYSEGTFTSTPLKGGSISDGLDVNKIEYQNYKSFERFIFHVVHWEGAGEALEGKAAGTTGHYELIPVNSNELQLYLGGFRALSAKLPSPTNTKMKRLRGEEYEDDSTIALLFTNNYKNSCQRVHADAKASQLIVDIKPC